MMATWLSTAHSLEGKVRDGQSILPLAAKIGAIYPEMSGYCRLVGPATSWCGLFVAYCLSLNGIRPPYNPEVDTKSFLWALAWADYGTKITAPSPGDILVFKFSGNDHHVTFFDHDNGNGSWSCLGGNQSNEVKLSDYRGQDCIAIRRPSSAGLTAEPKPVAIGRQKAITATVFGGTGDRETSAYDGHLISNAELVVALPYRFPGARSTVRVFNGNVSAVASIGDVGPWNTQDPYWLTSSRPQAESGRDLTGRITNKAGIDLSPALAKLLGIDGKGTVDWEFVTTQTTEAARPVNQQPSSWLSRILAMLFGKQKG